MTTRKQGDEATTVDSNENIDFSQGTYGVVPWTPGQIRLAYGVVLPEDAPKSQVRAAIAFVDNYAKREYDNIGKLVNKRLTVAGVMLPYIDWPLDPKDVYFDPDGNPVTTVERERTVLKVVAVNGRELEEPLYVGFMSDVVAREFRKKYIPMFDGIIGDWKETGDFEFEETTTRSGFRTYNVRFVG